jgi:GNAT superfamily N-acetyltransferase
MAWTYRHPVGEDIGLITSVMNMSRRETAFHRNLTTAEVNTETFDDPDYNPNGAWLVFDGDRPIAYGIGVVEKERVEAGMNDGWVETDVVPEQRNKCAEEELMALTVDYLRSRGMARAIARIEETEGWKTALYLRSGFKSVRHFYRLALRDEATIPPRTMPPGIEVTHKLLKDMSDDEVAIMSEVVNDTFSGHFDFAPQPTSRWIRWRDACEDPSMVSLAMTATGVAAVCIIEDSKGFNEERGVRSGWIDILGVRKPLRGRGIGAAMLVDGMTWLRSLGHDTIFIGVDAENEKALGLYRSLGFKVENQSQAYHLDLQGHE